MKEGIEQIEYTLEELEQRLQDKLQQITPADEQAAVQAKRRWDTIAKPLDSLGKLEKNVVRIAAIQGRARDLTLKKKALVIWCADHGVVEEGVTQTDASVTKIVTENFAKGRSTVNVMARLAGVEVFSVDIGMNTKPYEETKFVLHQVINRKIHRGTKNLARESAMQRKDCIQAILIGIETVKQLKEQGYDIIATGEMGIGNTTPTSCLAAMLLQKTPKQVVGKGAGLSRDGMQKKVQVIEKAIQRVQETYAAPHIIELLAELGGYDILGMTGVFLGGALYKVPIVIDGAISSIAALAAVKLEKKSLAYMLASHQSKELTGKLALETLGLEAMLQCDMCLGEGTGAVAAMPLLDMALQVYEEMSTFEENKIEDYIRFEEK